MSCVNVAVRNVLFIGYQLINKYKKNVFHNPASFGAYFTLRTNFVCPLSFFCLSQLFLLPLSNGAVHCRVSSRSEDSFVLTMQTGFLKIPLSFLLCYPCTETTWTSCLRFKSHLLSRTLLTLQHFSICENRTFVFSMANNRFPSRSHSTTFMSEVDSYGRC